MVVECTCWIGRFCFYTATTLHIVILKVFFFFLFFCFFQPKPSRKLYFVYFYQVHHDSLISIVLFFLRITLTLCKKKRTINDSIRDLIRIFQTWSNRSHFISIRRPKISWIYFIKYSFRSYYIDRKYLWVLKFFSWRNVQK